MAYFESITIYRVVATMEILFSVVILIFSSLTLDEFLNANENVQTEGSYILYSCVAGIILGIIQTIVSVLLIIQTRNPNNYDKQDYSLSKMPKLWFIFGIFSFGLLGFIFLATVLQKNNPKEFPIPLQSRLTEMFTYVICNTILKLVFIYAMFTTVKFRGSSNNEGGGGSRSRIYT